MRPELPKPALVVLCGFCWGNPDKVKPLDVIISDKIYSSNYQEATVSGLTRRCKPFASSVDIDDVEDINRSLVQHGFSVWTGAMASLETRLEDNRLRDDLIKENPQIFGGEMEAFGFLPSCKEPWLVVKAVSDFGGNDFSRTSQQQAALHAAITLKPLISALKRKRFLLDVEATPSQKLLLDLLRGDTVLLRSEDITAENLNDHLNNNIGVSVEYKLRSYSSDKEYGSEFVYEFCDLILELMQNSLRHGKANEVSVQFTEKSIIFMGKQTKCRCNLQKRALYLKTTGIPSIQMICMVIMAGLRHGIGFLVRISPMIYLYR